MTATLEDIEVTTPSAEPVVSRPARLDWWIVAILVVAAVIRLGFGLAAMDGPPPASWMTGGDQYSYWYYGDQIAAGHGYISYTNGKATSYYPIGYPATLAAVFWLQEHTPLPDSQPRAVALLHALMGTATVWFTYLIGRSLLGRRAGLAAAALVALFPNLVLNVPTYTLETAFVFWSTAALAVIATHDWRAGPPSNRRLLAFGTVLGLTVLTRPFSLPFVLGLLLAVLLLRAGWRRALASVAITLVPVLVLMTPWTIRNLHAMHAFVPISTNLGDTACLDRSMNADGGFQWAVAGCGDPSLPEAPRNRENIKKAASFVVHHPTKEVELMGKRFGRMVENDHSGLLESESVNGRVVSPGVRHALIHVADWYFWIVLSVAAIGFAGLLRNARRRPSGLLLATALFFLLLIPVELWGNVRFHIPALPFAALAACAAPLAVRTPEEPRP
jgi:4-amino-4-deoxy-L-arabinose transferase-like glycosyltransferase